MLQDQEGVNLSKTILQDSIVGILAQKVKIIKILIRDHTCRGDIDSRCRLAELWVVVRA